jgi:tRNA A-37 threonylcarbamoyl transferase component Bud32
MFEEEASNLQLANKLGVDSPKLHGYNSNKHVIAMEFLDGYDTYRNLRGQNKELDTLVNFHVFSNTRRMHTQGMVHRDLHSGNILVNPRTKRIAIIDFGHAKRKRDLDTEYFQRAVADEIQVLTDMTLNLTDSQAGKIIEARNRHMTFNHAPDSDFTDRQLHFYEGGVNKQRENFYRELATILLSF